LTRSRINRNTVVQAANLQEGSLLEIYQAEIDFQDKPTQSDLSEDRFVACYDGFLDSDIYQKGMESPLQAPFWGKKRGKSLN